MEPIFETQNLALYQKGARFEVHLQGATHAVCVGAPKDRENGERFMNRAERHILNLRRMYSHY